MNDAEPRAHPPTRAAALALCLLLVAVGVAVYSNALGSYFLSDDFVQVGRVLEGDLSVTWGREHGGFFRPLFVLSLAADAYVWRQSALGFHLTNVIIHALNSLLVIMLSLALTERAGLASQQRRPLSLAAGLIFLLHPSHTEAVTWISGRADLLSSFFCLTALLLFVSHTSEARRPLRLSLALTSFALALLSKESAVSLPLLTFLLGCHFARASDGRGGAVGQSLKQSAPFALLLVAYVAARAVALGSLVGGYGAGHHLNFSHSMIVSQLLRFPLRALFPANALAPLPFLESRALSPVLIAAGCAVVLLASVVARRGGRARLFEFLRGNKFLWLLLGLFLTALLPVINLRVDLFTTQGERLLYFPSAFSSITLAHVIFKSARGRRGRFAALFVVLTLYSFALWQTNRHWAATARLARRVLDQIARLSAGDEVLILNAPDNYAGAHLYRNGLPEALRMFQHAKTFRRADVLAWHSLRSPRDGALLTEEASVFTLRLADERATFERFNEPLEFVEILERSPAQMRFRLRGAHAPDIFYFADGEMVLVVRVVR